MSMMVMMMTMIVEGCSLCSLDHISRLSGSLVASNASLLKGTVVSSALDRLSPVVLVDMSMLSILDVWGRLLLLVPVLRHSAVISTKVPVHLHGASRTACVPTIHYPVDLARNATRFDSRLILSAAVLRRVTPFVSHAESSVPISVIVTVHIHEMIAR